MSGDSGSDGPKPRLRAEPEDFVVEEQPLYPASGEGAHTFLRVRKRLRNTEEVARELAQALSVSPRDVGYAGRKDRAALCTQWFSVPGASPAEAMALSLEGIEVLDAIPHAHKLRTGQLRGNRFDLCIRHVSDALFAQARLRLEDLIARGLPNRFGAQRFGRGGRNPEHARALLEGQGGRVDRRKARFLLSALQSEVFNRVLDTRPVPPDRLLAGDVAMVCASGGLFVIDDPDAEAARVERFEISPTGPIFGTKMMRPEGEAAALEARVMEALGVPEPAALRLPRGVRLRGTRRPLRVALEAPALGREDGSARLRVGLPPGSYVTVLVEALFGAFDEGPEPD